MIDSRLRRLHEINRSADAQPAAMRSGRERPASAVNIDLYIPAGLACRAACRCPRKLHSAKHPKIDSEMFPTLALSACSGGPAQQVRAELLFYTVCAAAATECHQSLLAYMPHRQQHHMLCCSHHITSAVLRSIDYTCNIVDDV